MLPKKPFENKQTNKTPTTTTHKKTDILFIIIIIIITPTTRMVSTRSGSNSMTKDNNKEKVEEIPDATMATTTTTTIQKGQSVDIGGDSSQKKKKTRTKNDAMTQKLRSKATGIGLWIDSKERNTVASTDLQNHNDGKQRMAQQSPMNQKVIFSDLDNEDMDNTSDKLHVHETVIPLENEIHLNKGQEDEFQTIEEDEDDVVEEVKGTIAKEQIQELQRNERHTARTSLHTKRNQKHRNKNRRIRQDNLTQTNDNPMNMEDEDFFTTLDQERANLIQTHHLQQEKLKSMHKVQSQGTHTTFVISGGAEHAPKVVKTDHDNIQVVVLETMDSATTSNTGKNMLQYSNDNSNSTDLYNRETFLLDGMTIPTPKEIQKAKKKGQTGIHRVVPMIGSWKRSKKMNRLLLSGTTTGRPRRGVGQAAVHFRVNQG